MLATSTLIFAMAQPFVLPLAGSPASAELSVRGQYRVRPGWGEEFLATVHLTLPLARLGGSGTVAPGLAKQTEARSEPDSDDETPEEQTEEEGEELVDVPDAAPGGDAGSPKSHSRKRDASEPVGDPAARREVTPELARETVDRALAHAGFGRARARVSQMLSRARYSALLPDLRLRAARRTDETLRLTPTLDDPYRYTLAGGSDLSFEASLTWRFDRLLFGGPEVSAERLLAQRSVRMQALARQVLDELFAWQRARLAEQDASALPEERERAHLEQLEAATRLFVMTGGWFSPARVLKTP